MSEIPKLLTPKELADILGVSQETLAQNRYLGQGVPYIKVGKRVRYQLNDVIAYLEANRVSNDA
ncbi:hypothetical protein MMAG44476_11099 [Mycolicibacterium mageritense DSM 44476 = CIP 104973]|uniref:Helix-turn-helix domain-containing protein n=1 Tax=Mycolicibacterium mageritense TaxID=53462 RepID=A0ABN5YC63_MYCME|nr:helix-turn-helix domain-containing protein [Mycolicibacterium mageritense]BBX35747.1 hypothetical protein MMAGJ_50290 [Mycolicibacterium mageritense]CDO19748.1 Helix-turn-helix domain protein [Mycolicibacterium mageritense DSM 44476 = CIP 104973]